jgi:hypothetical protein
MIIIDTYDDFDQERDYISIDLHTTRHKNRVIDFLEKTHPLSGEYEYEIRAQWTDSKFHPMMTMDEEDLIKFAEGLNLWVDKIMKRRAKGA